MAARAAGSEMLSALLDALPEEDRTQLINASDKSGITPVFLAYQRCGTAERSSCCLHYEAVAHLSAMQLRTKALWLHLHGPSCMLRATVLAVCGLLMLLQAAWRGNTGAAVPDRMLATQHLDSTYQSGLDYTNLHQCPPAATNCWQSLQHMYELSSCDFKPQGHAV